MLRFNTFTSLPGMKSGAHAGKTVNAIHTSSSILTWIRLTLIRFCTERSDVKLYIYRLSSETVCITYCKARSGIFPDDLKLSKVSLSLMPANTRIPKTIDQYLLYQFERIVYNQSIVYLKDNKIQSNHQSGFRS